MEKQILNKLNTFKPTATRKLMQACKVKSTKQVGVLTDEEFEFVKLLETMSTKGNIMLIEQQGWVKA